MHVSRYVLPCELACLCSEGWLRADWPHGKPVVAVVVVPVLVARIEVEVVRVVRVILVARGRPIVAVRPCVVERRTVAVAGGRQE